MKTKTLTPVEALALSKIKIPAKARASVAPGHYTGTLDVALEYDLKVGEDYEATHAASVPWMKIACVLFSRVNGATMESILREVLSGDLDELVDKVKDEAEEVIATITGETLRTFKGPVTGGTHLCNAKVGF